MITENLVESNRIVSLLLNMGIPIYEEPYDIKATDIPAIDIYIERERFEEEFSIEKFIIANGEEEWHVVGECKMALSQKASKGTLGELMRSLEIDLQDISMIA